MANVVNIVLFLVLIAIILAVAFWLLALAFLFVNDHTSISWIRPKAEQRSVYLNQALDVALAYYNLKLSGVSNPSLKDAAVAADVTSTAKNDTNVTNIVPISSIVDTMNHYFAIGHVVMHVTVADVQVLLAMRKIPPTVGQAIRQVLGT